MADSKITALTALTAADPVNDMFPVVDVSDTTMAASGTTKKISVNNILGASGTATLASATITGDLTVDTSTLKVDSTNNRVGIGTATPSVPLYVTGNNATATAIMQDETNGAKLRLLANSINFDITNGGGGGEIAVSGSNPLTFKTNGTERARIDSSGNVGIGATPSAWATYKAVSVGGIGASVFGLGSSQSGLVQGAYYSNLSGSGWAYTATSQVPAYYLQINGEHRFHNAISGTAGAQITAWTQAMTLDASGNLLVGVTSANANGGVLQLKSGITFPATQVAASDANTLDDYVESTFSPTIVGSTLAGTATYSTQIGRATKVGRLVTFSLRVIYTAGLGTGNLRIGGLPFTAGVSSNFSIIAENIALTAGNYPVAAISSGNTYIGIDQLPTGGGAAAAVPYDVSGDIQISGSYIV